MADEGLAYLIQVAVDASTVGPGISEAENVVAAGMARINETLQQSSSVEVFGNLVKSGVTAETTLRDITVAAHGAQEAVEALAQARAVLRDVGSSATPTVAGSLGLNESELRAQAIQLQQLRTELSGRLSSGQKGLYSAAASAEATGSIDGLSAALTRESLTAERAQAAMEVLARLGYGTVAEQALAAGAAAGQLEAQLERTRVSRDVSGAVDELRVVDLLREELGLRREIAAIREREAGATPALTAANFRTAINESNIDRADQRGATPAQTLQLAAQQEAAAAATLRAEEANRRLQNNPVQSVGATTAALSAQIAGLSAAEGKATLDVLAANERLDILLKNELATKTEIIRATNQIITATERLSAVQEKQAAAAATAAGGGGGGFFSGLGRGLGAHDGGNGSEDLGFQIGQVARYVVYYQIFRDIETAIKDSISETIQFERGVTNLSLQLGTSRDNARALATELGNVAAANGLNPSEGAALGGQFAGAFSDQAGADPTALARQGANVGSQLAIVSGPKEVSKDLFDATSAVHGFNLEASSTNRILDAATAAASHFLGSVDPKAILPGLAAIGDVAAAAGFSVEQTASLLGAVQQRTGADSGSAAQELRRILGREGQPAFQTVFAQQGIDTTLPLQQELTQLASKFDNLSVSQQRQIVTAIGGARGGAAVQAILEGYTQINDAADSASQHGGSFARAYGQRLNDLRGIITQLRGEFGNLAKDLGESGVFDGLALVLKTTLEIVKAADDVLSAFDAIPRPIRSITLGLLEAVAAARALGAAGVTGLGIGRINSLPLINRLPGGGGAAAAEEGAATGVGADVAAADAKIAAAGDTLAATLQAIAARVAAAGGLEVAAQEEVALQETGLAEGLRLNSAGAIIGPNGRFVSRAANAERLAAEDVAAGAGAGAAGAEGAAAGASSAVPILLGVAAVGIIGDAIVRAAQKQNTAIDAANSVTITGSSVDDLRAAASSAAAAAQAAKESSSGLTGSLVNLVRGDRTGDAAATATRIANLATAEANAVQAAQALGASRNPNDSANIDITTVGGVAAGFKEMAANGATASEQLAALNQRLAEFIQASQAGVNTITAAQAPKLGQDIANGATNALLAASQQAKATLPSLVLPPQLDGRVLGRSGRAPEPQRAPDPQQVELAKVQGLDLAQFDSGLATAAEQVLGTGGGQVDRPKLLAALQKAAPQILSRIGVSAEGIKQLGDVTNQAIESAISDEIAKATAGRGQLLTGAQAGDVAAAAIAALPQLSTEVTATVQSGRGTAQQNAQGATVAAAAAVAAAAKQNLTQLQRATQGTRSVAALNEQVAALQPEVSAGIAGAGRAMASLKNELGKANALTSSQLAYDQAKVALAQAQLTEANTALQTIQNDPSKSALLKAQQAVSVLRGALSQTTDPEVLRQLGLQMASALVTLGGQAILAANSALAAEAALNTALGQAVRDYANALSLLNSLHLQTDTLAGIAQASNQTATQSSLDALQARLTQEGLTKLQAQANKLNPQDTIGQDKNAVQIAENALNAAKVAGNTNPLDSNYQALVKGVADAKTKLASDANQLAQDQALAGAGTGRLDQASGAVKAAKIKLDGDKVGTDAYYRDLAAYHAAQTSLGKAASAGAKDDPFNANLEASIDPRDTLALAAAKLTEDAHAAGSATTQKARAEGRLGLVKDQLALEQARAAQEEARRSATARIDDPVAQAIAALANARQQVALDLKGTQQYWQDYAALQQAKQALAQANLDHSKVIDQLRSDTTDPVAQANNAVKEAQRKLNADKRNKTGDINQDELDLVTAEQAKQKATFDSQLQAQQQAYQLHQESTLQYSNYLQSQDASIRKQLAGMKKGQEGYQQLVDELGTIDQAIESLNSQLEGQFNLGDIKLPTVYEVRRQVAANAGTLGGNVQQNNTTYVNIDGADFQKVVDYINSILSKQGTVVATTGRKAA